LWLNDTSYVAKVSEEVNRYSAFLGTHWYKFQPPTPTLSATNYNAQRHRQTVVTETDRVQTTV